MRTSVNTEFPARPASIREIVVQNGAFSLFKLGSVAALICSLGFLPSVLAQSSQTGTQSAAQAPCTTTAGLTTPQNGSAAQNNSNVQAQAKNVENAAKQLGSLFKKKQAATPTASANPCPQPAASAPATTASANAPAAAASPVATTASSAPAAATSQSAADPALASWRTADPFVPDAGRGGAGGATAAAGASGAPASGSGSPGAPPDFAKLPDIGGFLRVGLTIDQSKDALAKMHPKVKITYGRGSFDTIQPVSRDGNPPLAGLHGQFPNESIFFWYSQPPNRPQVAFSVGRGYQYPAPGIDRAKLVAALRQKYGPETKANRRYTTHEEPGDENITEMYWYYDEQGNFIASDKGSSTVGQPPFNCGTGSSWDPHSDSAWGGLLDAIRLNRLPAPGYCDTLVTLRITLSPQPPGPVTQTATSLDDSALLRRDGLDAGAVAKARTQQQQQQQLDKSKQAKPSL